MAKEGSTVCGLMDSFACAVSIALQHGVPLKLLCEKFAHTRFEPSGWSDNPDIGFAKSIMDYIFRWLQLRFLTGQQQMLFENLRPKLAAGDGQRRRQSPSIGVTSVGDTALTRPEPKPTSREPVSSTPPTPWPNDRHGRRAQLPRLRLHHGEKRQLLQVHELRKHERVQLGRV